MSSWCVVILRDLICTEAGTGVDVHVDDVVSVYGPFTQPQANARAEQFNAVHGEADNGAPLYQPISNAPAFLRQEEWVEYWAEVRPMNDITW